MKFPSLRPTVPAFLCLALLSGCFDDGGPADPGRAPLDKADAIGTCEDHCGEQSNGSCWCDDQCEDFGDCCGDRPDFCPVMCPDIVMPGPSFCPDGEVVPVVDENGCTTSFECVICPDVVMPGPTFCPDGEVVPVVDENGCTTSFECVICPDVVMPGPSFCPDGEVLPVVDENGCTTSFECQL